MEKAKRSGYTHDYGEYRILRDTGEDRLRRLMRKKPKILQRFADGMADVGCVRCGSKLTTESITDCIFHSAESHGYWHYAPHYRVTFICWTCSAYFQTAFFEEEDKSLERSNVYSLREADPEDYNSTVWVEYEFPDPAARQRKRESAVTANESTSTTSKGG